jgi:cell division protein FtsW (lipid II flippase)
MVDIPDVIISKPRKFAHDTFCVLTALAVLIAAVNLLAGNIGTAILYGTVVLVLGNIASKIKFKWVLRRGVVEYV